MFTKFNRVLICGTNWIGDSIMTMPALQIYRKLYPQKQIFILVKQKIIPLWQMHSVPDGIIMLCESPIGTFRTIRHVKTIGFDCAYIFPLSFRAALIPFLAKIPNRIGMPGHFRDWMLTEIKPPPQTYTHQAYEYINLLAPGQINHMLENPVLNIPQEAQRKIERMFQYTTKPLISFLPGAARGVSKQWPVIHFIELGKKLVKEMNASIILMGSSDDIKLCHKIECAIDKNVLNISGKTSLYELAAALRSSDLVVSNDSGGMHIASAVNTPVVAIYGITDPAKTGPLNGGHILQNSAIKNRNIKRTSALAQKYLFSIDAEQVYASIQQIIIR